MDVADIRKQAYALIENRSPSTVAEYLVIRDRLDGQHWHTYATERCLAKRSAAVLRSASRFNKARMVLLHLSTMNMAQKIGDKDAAKAQRQQAEALIRSLDEPEPTYQPPGPVKRRKSSKRRSLSRLPKDWREQVLQELKPDDLIPAVVLILTGCRPVEYKYGVIFERHGDQLRATIHGGKCSTLTQGGQKIRALDFSGQDALARALLRMVDKNGGRFVTQGDLGAWRKRLTRAGERVGLRRLSPYSLRHQFASDQKQRGWNDDRLSQALGQASDRTRKHYGHSEQGRGRGGGLQSVSASVAVRQKAGPVPNTAPAPVQAPEPATDLGMDLDVDDFEPGPGPG
jgi:integrase